VLLSAGHAFYVQANIKPLRRFLNNQKRRRLDNDNLSSTYFMLPNLLPILATRKYTLA
jgi:hypothetical protein